MNILCTICRDLVTPADLCTTKCGHLFHQACVSQWLARSKSCPQCRGSITSKCIFHLYVTTPEEDALGNDDAATLQAKLDDTMLMVRQQSMEITALKQKLTQANLNLEETIDVLKAGLKIQESFDSDIAVYREIIINLEIKNTKLLVMQKEFEQCQKKMQALKEALFESEAKKTELLNKLQETTIFSKNLLIKYDILQKLYEARVKTKFDQNIRNTSLNCTLLNTSDTGLNTPVNNIEENNPAYFNLKKNSLGWTSVHHQKPSTNKNLFDPSKLQKAFNHKSKLNSTKKSSESNVPLNRQNGTAPSKIPVSTQYRLKRPYKVPSMSEVAKKP